MTGYCEDMATIGNKAEETENAPTQTKISWPIKKENYELKDVIGKWQQVHTLEIENAILM